MILDAFQKRLSNTIPIGSRIGCTDSAADFSRLFCLKKPVVVFFFRVFPIFPFVERACGR